jgi:predicted Rossmann-fold nucleotide-binding protein
MFGQHEREVQQLEALLPKGPRLAVIGSSDFWHGDSEATCAHVGQLLAGIPTLVLVTGGVEGIGEAIGRSFFATRRAAGQEPCVYHVLPRGEPAWDYGETLLAGDDMTGRREVLGRLAPLFLALEGGPGVKHEAEVAAAHHASIIPVGRSGGFAAELYARTPRPQAVDEQTWEVLGSATATPEETARAVVRAVEAILRTEGTVS